MTSKSSRSLKTASVSPVGGATPTIELQVRITSSDFGVEDFVSALGRAAAQALVEAKFDESIERAMSKALREASDDQKELVAARPQAPKAEAQGADEEELLIDSKQAAKLLGVSDRKLWSMQISGEMPKPIRLGRAVRWRRADLLNWVADGCPDLRRRR